VRRVSSWTPDRPVTHRLSGRSVGCMSDHETHEELAGRLRRRVRESGVLAWDMREGAFATGAGEDARLPEVYARLARLVGEASYRVTDEHVATARDAAGSDMAAFELIMSSSVGAGLARWDAATRAIEGATDAP
jgi:hypothetical protein